MRTHSRIGERAVGLGALVLLLGLLVVPPVTLAAAVGWPLPTGLPSLDVLDEVARRGISDSVIVKALAVVAWVAWLQVAVAALAEIVAVVRGRTTGHLPVAAGVQVWVARLVATALLLVASGGPGRPAVAAPAPAAVHLVVDTTLRARSLPEVAPASGPVAEATSAVRYEVQRRDTLWSIAERHLGDGRRWREIADLNLGRAMLDERVLDREGGHIEPGWVLLLPVTDGATTPVATALPVAGGPPAAAVEPVVVEPGEHLWLIAEEELAETLGRNPSPDEVRPYWEQVVELNRDRLADPDDPGLVFAGQELLVPTPDEPPVAEAAEVAPTIPAPPIVPEPAPATTPVPPTTTPTLSTAAADPADRATRPATSDGDQPAGPEGSDEWEEAEDSALEAAVLPGLLGVAGSAIALGLARALRRRRRLRLMRLSAGVEPPLPDPVLDELRSEIALSVNEEAADALHQGLGALAAAVVEAGRGVRPRLVQFADGALEALLSEALPAPEGWRSEGDGRVWTGGCIGGASDGEVVATPLLVTLGRAEESGQLYLDLEAERLLSVGGDEAEAQAFVRSVVVELAHSALAETARILVVGDVVGTGLDRLDRVEIVERWADVADEVLSWSEQSREVVTDQGWADAFEGRVRNGDTDGLAALLVVVSSGPDEHLYAAAVEAVAGGDTAVTIVVVGGEISGATRVEVDGGELRLPALDLVCRAQLMEEDALDAVVHLLTDAASTNPVEDVVGRCDGQLPLLRADDDMLLAEAIEDGYRDPPHHVLVRLLGVIEVVGGVRPLTPKQTAVVTHIALHAPVLAERVEGDVWTTPTASRRKRLADILSQCRALIGAAQLPAAVDGRYRLGPGVRTDLDLFERRVQAAVGKPPEIAVELLRGAVELIHGRPFQYRDADTTSYVWVDVENWHTTWELRVTTAAVQLSELYLKLDDPDGAVWAAQQGLLASPLDTHLTEALMRAYTAGGDRLAAERVYQNHVAGLEKLQIDEVAESTSDLRERLRNGEDVKATA